jgi:hypothetical protein
MFSLEVVGKLVLVRLASPMDGEGAARFVEKSRTQLLKNAEKVVTYADLRDLMVLAPEVADVMTTLLVRNAPRIERSALVVRSLHGSLGMQLHRIMGAAKHPARRLFDDARAAGEYLREVLGPAEQEALSRFGAHE